MATTTNYGWTTPDDTALVKDGAAAIRTLGSSVDTTTKNLNPSTTLGDVEYRSSTANTNTRLGIGTTGQVLTVSGGVPSWATPAAGGMTLLSTTTLSGATVTISGIDQSYVNLFAIVTGMTNATTNGFFRLAPNGTTNISTYQMIENASVTQLFNERVHLQGNVFQIGSGNSDNIITFTIDNYASTTKLKTINSLYGYNDTGNTQRGGSVVGYIKTTSAITSLVFDNNGGNLLTGTVLLYGVK